MKHSRSNHGFAFRTFLGTGYHMERCSEMTRSIKDYASQGASVRLQYGYLAAINVLIMLNVSMYRKTSILL